MLRYFAGRKARPVFVASNYYYCGKFRFLAEFYVERKHVWTLQLAVQDFEDWRHFFRCIGIAYVASEVHFVGPQILVKLLCCRLACRPSDFLMGRNCKERDKTDKGYFIFVLEYISELFFYNFYHIKFL
jgi:hypothetical protein